MVPPLRLRLEVFLRSDSLHPAKIIQHPHLEQGTGKWDLLPSDWLMGAMTQACTNCRLRVHLQGQTPHMKDTSLWTFMTAVFKCHHIILMKSWHGLRCDVTVTTFTNRTTSSTVNKQLWSSLVLNKINMINVCHHFLTLYSPKNELIDWENDRQINWQWK